jgi:LysR family transcriptional activator of nhaA
MEWLNFRHLYAFWMVSHAGGFKLAADRMFIAQSAVSDHVAQLEQYFGDKLVERSSRPLKLTPAGASLLQHADRVFSQSREINQLYREKRTGTAPLTLRIGIAGGISRNFLYRRLAHVLTTLEGIHIDIVSGAHNELGALLRGLELDVLLSAEATTRKDLVQLEQHVIGSSMQCLAGKKSLMRPIIQGKAPRGRLDIYTFRHPAEFDVVKDLLGTKLGLNATERISSDDISLLRFLANSGLGLAVIPEAGLQEDLESGAVTCLPLPELPAVNFYASFLRQSYYRETLWQLFARE